MANRIIRLADSPTLADELGLNARKRILSSYTLEHSIHRINRVLEAAARRESMACIRDSINAGYQAADLSATNA